MQEPRTTDPDVTGPAQRKPPTATEQHTPVLPRGTCVGRYVIIDKLGQGGMGVVYKAYDPELDRTIALKLLRPRGNEPDGANLAMHDRLLREAKALARLAHPNVIAIHDVGTFESQVFLAMEFVAGRTLRGWLDECQRTYAEIVATFVAAGEGLAAAHRAGLVHRDFKPANVVVGDDGRVRVLDFGLARAADMDSDPIASGAAEPADQSHDGFAAGSLPTEPELAGAAQNASTMTLPLAPPTEDEPPELKTIPRRHGGSSGSALDASPTAAGAIMGTPAFMSPEQHVGRGNSARADQWSFCVSLYGALYGAPPFAGATVDKLRRSVLAGAVVTPPLKSSVPRRLRQIVLRGMQTSAALRYPSMDELLADLRHDPRVRRWTIAAAAAVLVLAAGTTAFVLRTRPREDLVCAGASAKLDGVWDAGRKRAVHDAFAKTGMPYAAHTFASVERVLDDYARAWVAMHTESCRATRVLGEQSEELLDLRMQCLGQRRDELAAKVEIFTTADTQVVEKALPAAAGLTRLDGCADVEALRAPIRAPADPYARQQVDAIRVDVTRARALEEMGKFKEGLRLAEAALPAARKLGYRPLEAEAGSTVALLRERSGDYAGAAQTYKDAGVAALAGRHDELAAQIYVSQVALVGDRQGKFDEADEIARLAEASLERLRGSDSTSQDRLRSNDVLLAKLLSHQGLVSYRRGRYEDALAHHKRALATFERLQPDHPNVGGALAAVAEDYRALAKLDEAQAFYERALAHRQKLLGPAHPLVAATLSNLGNVLADRGLHDAAISNYQKALEVWEPSLGEDHPYIAGTLNNAADELRILGRYDEALTDLQRAAMLWEKRLGKDHPEMAVAHHNLGELHRAKGEYEQALVEFDRALVIRAARVGTDHPNYAVTLNARAEMLRELGRIDEARTDQRRALATAEKALGPNHPEVLDIIIGLGRTDIAAGAAARAVPLLERAVAGAAASPGDGSRLADARFELARALVGSGGDHTRAIGLAQEARATWVAAGAGAKRQLAATEAWLASPR